MRPAAILFSALACAFWSGPAIACRSSDSATIIFGWNLPVEIPEGAVALEIAMTGETIPNDPFNGLTVRVLRLVDPYNSKAKVPYTIKVVPSFWTTCTNWTGSQAARFVVGFLRWDSSGQVVLNPIADKLNDTTRDGGIELPPAPSLNDR
jgi:hypothetical protein